MAKYGPFPAPMVSEVVGNGCKMILTTFYYTLVLWKNALKCIPWAGDDPVLLLAVSLEANIGRTNFFHFPLQLTSLSMRKVVKVMCQFWWILLSIWLHSAAFLSTPHCFRMWLYQQTWHRRPTQTTWFQSATGKKRYSPPSKHWNSGELPTGTKTKWTLFKWHDCNTKKIMMPRKWPTHQLD